MRVKARVKATAHFPNGPADGKLEAKGYPPRVHADGRPSIGVLWVAWERAGVSCTAFMGPAQARQLAADLVAAADAAEGDPKPCEPYCCKRDADEVRS